MKWPSWVLACALVVFAIWAFAAEHTPPPPPGVPEASPAPAGPHAERTSLAPAAAPRSTVADESSWLDHLGDVESMPLAAAADDPEAVELRGRLTVRQRPWVHPAGVEVRLTRHWLDTVVPTEASPDADLETTREPVAVTTADGRFAFRFRPVAGELFFLIDRRGAWMDYQKVPRLPGAGMELDLGEVWLDDRGGIRGLVLGSDDKPLANVDVRAIDDTLSDAGSGLGDLHDDRTRDLELFTASGATDFGPLPSWVVRRDLLLPFPTTTTDAEGRFELRGLRPGTHSLFFQHPHACGSLRDVQAATSSPTEVGVVRLRRTELVELRFVDQDGQPWVDASVALLHARPGFGAAPQRTSSRGDVLARVASLDSTRIAFAHPGGGPWSDLGALRHNQRIVRVPRLPEIQLTLSDALGTALPGGRVRFFVTGVQLRPADRLLPAWMQPVERRPGMHVGRGLPSTIAVARVHGYAPAIAKVTPGGDNTLALLPMLHNTVRVRDREHRAIAGATVYLQVHAHDDLRFRGAQWDLLANDRMRAGVTDETGALEVPVWATWFSIQATHPEFAAAVGAKFVPQPDAVIDLTLPRRAGIHGTLAMQHRAAAAGFRVRARQHPPRGHEQEHNGFLAEHVAVTGDDGTFAFRNLCAGTWELQPEFPTTPSMTGASPPRSAFASEQVWLDEGQELHLVLEASRADLTAPQITGIVRQNGAVVADALVRVRGISPLARHASRARKRAKASTSEWEMPASTRPWLQQCTTDYFGDFDFAGLEPGEEHELSIDVSRDGRLQFLRRFVVRTPRDASAGPVRCDVDLETGSARLQCSRAGQPFAGRMLRLREVLADDQEGACFELLTDAHGDCFADDLPAGRWTVEPMHGGSLQPAELTIRARTIVAASFEHLP